MKINERIEKHQWTILIYIFLYYYYYWCKGIAISGRAHVRPKNQW